MICFWHDLSFDIDKRDITDYLSQPEKKVIISYFMLHLQNGTYIHGG